MVDEQTKDLKNKINQLKEARRRERDIVDIMGHELRTPMTVIQNYHELMGRLIDKNKFKSKSAFKKYQEYMDIIGLNIQKEISLINVLLDSAKLESGQMELNKEPVDILDLIDDAILCHKGDAKSKDLYIKYLKPKSHNFPKIYADKIRVHEILDNLISNAIKYTNQGGLEIKVDSIKDYVRIIFSDTGIGMEEKDLKNIGKKFYRSNQYLTDKNDKVHSERPSGTGLGLFVTFNLIKTHGGKVKVSSKLGKGSVFTVTLPTIEKEQGKEDVKNREE